MSPLFNPASGASYAAGSGISTLGGSATDIGPIVIPAGMGLLVVDYYIAGYSASQIAQLRLGTGATVDTAANYSSFTSSLGTTTTAGTSRVSGTGVPVSQVAQTTARRGGGVVRNHSGQNKVFTLETVDYSSTSPTAATGMANMATVVGSWFNTTQAQSISLNSGGAGTLNAGSFLAVYWFPGTS
jgi:hypothetical protein